MKKIDNDTAIKWLSDVSKSVERLADEKPGGMIKAKLNRLKKQIDVIVEEMQNEEKT